MDKEGDEELNDCKAYDARRFLEGYSKDIRRIEVKVTISNHDRREIVMKSVRTQMTQIAACHLRF
jgi:hypothetical protein